MNNSKLEIGIIMKRIVFCSTVLISTLLCSDINETKIFLDKHDYGIKQYSKNIQIQKYDASDIDIGKLHKDINISEAVKLEANEIAKNRLKDISIENQAKQDMSIIHTDKFNKQIREAKDYLLYDKKLNWGEQAVVAQKYIDEAGASGEQNFYFNSAETIYIFISSSIPKQTILNYLENTKYIQSNIVFVLQGAIGGIKKLRPTMSWIKDLLTDKYINARIIIDPRLANIFTIRQVPAVVYTQKDLFELEAEQNNLKTKSNEDTYIFYGDMPFEYAIKSLNDKKHNQFLENLLRKLDTK